MSAPDPGPTQEPEQTQAPEQAPETTQAQTPEGLDRLYERMDQMARTQQQLVESMTAYAQPEEEYEEPVYYDDEGELTEEGARAVLGDLVREQIETAMAPREQARRIAERDDAFEALRDEYPELQDDKVSEQVLAQAVRWAQGINPDIIERPEFVDVIEAFYKASKFETLAAQQQAEQPRSVVLESGQGAGRPQTGKQEDWGARIVAAAERLRPQI